MGNVFFFQWEVNLITWIQTFADKFVIMFASFFTMFAEVFVYVGVIGFVYWGLDKEAGKRLGTNLMMALLGASFIKNIFIRRRPYFDNPRINCLKPVDANADVNDVVAQGFSMPSMHSSNAVSLFGTLAQIIRKKWFTILAILLPVFVGVSRIILGVHYPTDVLLGWGIGLLSIIIGTVLEKKHVSRLTTAIVISLLFIPGWFFCQTSDYFSSYGITVGVLFGFYFEEKMVGFQNTGKWLYRILRFIGGLCVILLLCEGIKMLFPESIVNGTDFAAHLFRSARYAVGGFAGVGVYPLLFRLIEKNPKVDNSEKDN